MTNAEKRIGHIHPNRVDYPEETLSGQAYARPPESTRGLSHGRFVVLDNFPPPGFDIDAEIEKLVEADKPAKPSTSSSTPPPQAKFGQVESKPFPPTNFDFDIDAKP